ncbi:MAG: OmpA family protein [Candidatus Gastranaerophilales bacterium]|nr:OmpA family protein [Candidatus Gastranaerophilales bacterium]
MTRRYRKKRTFEEPGYWQSYSDMMAALLLIFILIIAITLAIYKQKTTDLEKTQVELNAAKQKLETATEELELAKVDLDNYRSELEASRYELEDSLLKLQEAYDAAALTQEQLAAAYLEIDEARGELESTRSQLQDIVGVRTDIIGELQSVFNNSSMEVDAQNGSISFSSDVLFKYGSASLTDASKATLTEIIPMYLDVLLQDRFRDYIAEIIIEGHTDTSGSYQHNMNLSSSRASSVARYILDPANGLDEDKIEKLQSLLTINGRSYSSPIYVEGTDEIDMAASRRVEIKFRLKEEELIQRISEILSQTPEVE